MVNSSFGPLLIALVASAITSAASESSDIVSLQYRGKHVCTGVQLDVDFVLTGIKCVNVSQQDQLSISRLTEVRSIDHVSKRFGFGLVHFRPALKLDQLPLTAIESPDNGEECEVLNYSNEVGFKSYYVRIVECGGSLADKPVICVRGYFKKDPGAILKCRTHVAGVFVQTRIFADVAKYNDWIDETFRSVITAGQASDLAVEEDRIVEAFPELEQTDRKKLVCLLQFSECYQRWSAGEDAPQKCKRGFHPYGCDFLLRNFDQDKEQPQGREARAHKLDYRADELEDGVLKEFWTWVDHHNKQYLGF